MNAIEQMMQAFSANSAQSMAAFFGTASASTSATGFAEQFAAALQGTAATNPLTQALADGDINIYALTSTEGSAATATALTPQQVKNQLTTDAAIDLASPAQVAEQVSPDGFQLVKVTPENFATLFAGMEATSNTGQPASANSGEAQFLIVQAPGNAAQESVHILPVAELEALLAPASVVSGTETQPAATAATAAATTATPAAASATAAPTTATVSTPVAGDAAVTTVPNGEAKTLNPDLAAPLANQGKPEAAVEQAADKTLAERAGLTAAAKAPKEQPVAGDAKQQKTAEAEAQGVQTQQVATNKKPAASNNATTTNTNNASANNQAAGAAAANSSSNGQSGSNNQSGEQKQSKSDEQQAAPALNKRAAAPTPQTPPLSSLTSSWTLERVSGFGDGSTPEAFSAGLSGLRGESSFMSGMSLLGGKASPQMGGQIAKQLNLQVTNAVKNGANEFTMRLDPAELGRVQVKMQFTADGKVAAQVMVERPETLELLQREMKGFERAIEAGGHKADANGISFSLDTGNGESAGKAFAEAMQEDRLKEQIEQNGGDGQAAADDEAGTPTEETDLAMLEEILSRVTPETGLDVRI